MCDAAYGHYYQQLLQSCVAECKLKMQTHLKVTYLPVKLGQNAWNEAGSTIDLKLLKRHSANGFTV